MYIYPHLIFKNILWSIDVCLIFHGHRLWNHLIDVSKRTLIIIWFRQNWGGLIYIIWTTLHLSLIVLLPLSLSYNLWCFNIALHISLFVFNINISTLLREKYKKKPEIITGKKLNVSTLPDKNHTITGTFSLRLQIFTRCIPLNRQLGQIRGEI